MRWAHVPMWAKPWVRAGKGHGGTGERMGVLLRAEGPCMHPLPVSLST